jgi:hypothetical protein
VKIRGALPLGPSLHDFHFPSTSQNTILFSNILMHPTLWALILATERHPSSIIACDKLPAYSKVQRGEESTKVTRQVLQNGRLLLTKQDHNATESGLRQRSLEGRRRQARRDAEINRQIQERKRRFQGETAKTTA